MAADAPRRFLVAAGTEHYDDGSELISVPDDLRKIEKFFGRLGYREQLPEVRLDPSSSELRKALSEWLNGPDRLPSDTAVIYYSGHGDSQASYFYLLTADTRENRYADTAVRADFVLEALGEIPRVRRLLLILDTCYAGQGAFNAADVAARMSPWQSFGGDDEGVWVVAAASPKQEAQERLFAEAFLEAAEQLQQTTGTLQPYIGLEALIWQINAILRRRGKRQRASWIPATQARGLAPFIPNARYDPDAPANLDLETRDWLRRRHSAELAEHWGPKARGVEVAAQAGWYFTGRQAALAELTAWIADPATDTRLRVVTGDPGSGKSAVLGRLVTLADTSPAPKPPGPLADPDSAPPVGSIEVALLARGKTADELLRELATSLGVAPAPDLMDTLVNWPVFTVVIDALDEAVSPAAVAERVIVPLHRAASPSHGPRLLVAARRYERLLESLPTARVTIDLDQDTYRDETDTADYVTKVLLAADDPDSPTPYRDQPDLARLVAREVAAVAGHSFLIAQIAARTLARTPRPLAPAEVAADRARWRDVGAAFDRDLDRYGEEAQRIRDLLAPLAWAEGAGLPRELWAPLAVAVADGQDYGPADITWLLEQAGFYLVETLDQDRSVYRLYHEQFAEHLRGVRGPGSAHERITTALLRHVPVTAEGRREWLAATPYIRNHLATHAARACLLDPLVNDPGFLLAADPVRLLPALATVTDREARKSASAFESTQNLLLNQPPGQATAQLGLAARVYGASTLADGIDSLPYQRPWTIAWGHWARPDRHVLLGRHTAGVRAVTAATIDASPVAVTGGSDGAVRAWDLRAGTARGEPLRGHIGGVFAVATGELDGTQVAVTGGTDGTVRVWDLRAGTARGVPLRGHAGEVLAVAIGEVDGTPVAVTGSSDGTVRVWDLRAGTARGSPLRSHRRAVEATATGVVDRVPVAVTGGRDGMVRVWDLRTGIARGSPLRGHASGVFAVATGEVDGIPVAVTGGTDGTVRVWDLRTGTARGEPLRGHIGGIFAVAVGEVDGVPVAVTGGRDGTVRVWNLRTGTARRITLRGHTGGILAVAIAEVNGTPRAVTGGSDGTVRAWNLLAGTAAGQPRRGQNRGIVAVAAAELDGIPVAVTGGRDGTVRIWDLRTGTARRRTLRGHTGGVSAVAIADVDGDPVAVTTSSDGTVRTWSLRGSALCGEPLRGYDGESEAVATASVDGTPVAVSGGRDGTVCVWDLRAGTVQWKPLRGHAGDVLAVATGSVDGMPVAVSGGRDGTVCVWDLRAGTVDGKPLRGHAGEVFAVATGTVDGIPVAVTGGRDGTLQIWDLRARIARGEPIRGHAGGVKAVALGTAGGIPVVVSGDDKGMIRMRDLDQGQHHSVRFNAFAGITSIAFGNKAGWVTATQNGSLFTWYSSSTF